MATAAQILKVRKDARLWGYEYFTKNGSKQLEMIKQQPPISVISIYKNNTSLSAESAYSFDGYKLITLTTAPAETDVIRVEFGHTVTDSEVGDIIDFSKEEIYSDLRSYYDDSSLDSASFVDDIYLKLAAGYLIMKFWEGFTRGEDFWKMGRNWVDEAHKRVDEIRDGRLQLIDGSGDRIAKDISPVQYEILDESPGLMPSGLYSENAEDLDEEVY